MMLEFLEVMGRMKVIGHDNVMVRIYWLWTRIHRLIPCIHHLRRAARSDVVHTFMIAARFQSGGLPWLVCERGGGKSFSLDHKPHLAPLNPLNLH